MKKIKVSCNKLDIYVLLLIISTTIPLICNKYVSLSGTIQTILQYLYAYGIYLIFREIAKKHKKFIKVVIPIVIIMTVLIILIGIDGITTNWITRKIGVKLFENGEDRLISVIGYANTLATYIASVLFLTIHESLKENRKEIKAIYKTVILIFIIGIILTYSKAIIILLPASLAIYLLMIKDKKTKIELLQNIIIAGILSVLFVMIFEKLSNTRNYLWIWLTFAILVLTYYVINLKIKKIEIKKVSTIALGVVFITFVAYIAIALNFYGEYIVFVPEIESDYGAKVINSIQGNTEYVFEFDLEAKAPRDIENTYIINLLERDDKNQELKETNIKFGTFSGKKQLKIRTQEKTAEVKIEFKSEYPYTGKKLVIKSLRINEKEIPLRYKYLPTKLVEKVQNISIHYKTAKERIEMIKNAIQITKRSPIIGQGGNAWEHTYQEVQSYPYIAKQLHSYPAKIILEFGMLGIIAYLGIAIIMIKIAIKAVKNQNMTILSMIFAFFIIGIHSMIDIDMEYTIILFYTFGIMGILATELEEKEAKEKKNKIVNIVLVMIAIVILYWIENSKDFNKYTQIGELLRQRNGLTNYSQEYQTINKQIAECYEEITKFERYGMMENYKNIITYTLASNHENKLEVIKKYYQKILEDKTNTKDKIKIIYDICENLEEENNPIYDEMIGKFMNIIEKEDADNSELKEMKSRYLLGVRIINESEFQIEEEKLAEIEIERTQEMLLYHTHGTESYRADTDYETYDFYKSLDENYNVIKVGSYLAELLKQKGIPTTHSKAYNNYPNKWGTYAKSRKAVEEILSKNEKINKIIDIHRDAYSEEEHTATTIEINGEQVAPMRFVIGINKEDENWMYDLKWAIAMQKIANEKYPSLMQPILIREEEYNQDLSKYAVLVEVGENCNKIEHALNSMKYFSQIIQ